MGGGGSPHTGHSTESRPAHIAELPFTVGVRAAREAVAAALLATLLLLTVAANAGNILYFYGGDFDPNNPNANGLANETDRIVGGSSYGAAAYQNFVVGSGITVTGLFTNDLMSISPTNAYWEIRSGVSLGNGGTLIASGMGLDTVTATGRNAFGYTEYNNLVMGLDVPLAAGTYWFIVVPNGDSQIGRSFESNTFGLNSVGTSISNDQFFNSSFYGVNFGDPNDQACCFPNFSAGVYVSSGGTTPEPSSILLLGSGILGLAGVLRRKLTR
ncbi:MAG: PEP-CTERM sorting domain-containing protein [Candidatus Korobacteraceae bacterium]